MRYYWDIGREASRSTIAKPAMTATINGRNFEITENTDPLPNLRAWLVCKGFDGTIWTGFSARTGRQRKDLHSMIYRSNNGGFVIGGTL